MGQGRSTLSRQSKDGCDLSEEQVEEIRMITSRLTIYMMYALVPVKEIHRIRRKFRTVAKNEEMSKDEFYALPGIAINPLRDRLLKTIELSPEQTIPFSEFARFLSIFSYHSSQDAKLKEAFKIHDFDGDGKISREDLRAYMNLVMQRVVEDDSDTEAAKKAHQELIDLVISRMIEEASSDPSRECLLFEDFVKVIQATDYESRLIISF